MLGGPCRAAPSSPPRRSPRRIRSRARLSSSQCVWTKRALAPSARRVRAPARPRRAGPAPSARRRGRPPRRAARCRCSIPRTPRAPRAASASASSSSPRRKRGARAEDLGGGEREHGAARVRPRERRVEDAEHVAVGVHDHERGEQRARRRRCPRSTNTPPDSARSARPAAASAATPAWASEYADHRLSQRPPRSVGGALVPSRVLARRSRAPARRSREAAWAAGGLEQPRAAARRRPAARRAPRS